MLTYCRGIIYTKLLLLLCQCQSLVEELSASHSTDLQQRAYELQAVIGLDAHAVESIMPSDASCEDIEVITYHSIITLSSNKMIIIKSIRYLLF